MKSVSLTLVGTTAGEAEILPTFHAADQQAVRVIPRLEDTEGMRRMYVEHDVLVAPSLSEGSPLALLEAMAAGLPLVASRVGGVSDLVTNGAEGFLFEPLDVDGAAASIIKLLTDEMTWRAMSVSGHARALALPWQATAIGIEAACDRALQRVSR